MAAGCWDVQGHVGYLSPEGIDLFGNPEQLLVGLPSDMWTVGCLLLEVLIGQPVFITHEVRKQPGQAQLMHIMQCQAQWVSCTLCLSFCVHALMHGHIYALMCDMHQMFWQ